MKTKILITGANSFIGQHLIKRLSNFEIYSINREDGDISDESFVKSLFPIKPHIIIHLAFDINRENNHNVYLKQLNSNIKSMLLIANLAKQSNAKIIIPSTVSLYSESKSKFNENTRIEPNGIYSLSKYVCEQITKIYNLDYLILRIGIVYGKNQKYSMLIPNIIKHIKENKTIEIFGGDQVRDFLYIDDLCDLINYSILNNISGLFNVGFGKSYSIKQVIEIIENIMNKKCKVKYKKIKDNEITNYKIDNSLIKKVTNWKPKTSLEKGLKIII